MSCELIEAPSLLGVRPFAMFRALLRALGYYGLG
jgi:hypothetical protein